MKTIFFSAKERGFSDHGWLKAAHSFSFGNYHNPAKVHFGLLRVLNDDIVAPGMGFGKHPHDNMEIVTIPLRGSLAHKDSLGSEGLISPGEVQVMSAGTGIEHSEYNGSVTEEVNLLQIWIFPKQRSIEPRYEQKRFDQSEGRNTLKLLVSPKENSDTLWINQDAYFSQGTFTANSNVSYSIRHPGNGAYIFLIDGKAEISGKTLVKRDALGVFDTESFEISFTAESEVLVIEVPME